MYDATLLYIVLLMMKYSIDVNVVFISHNTFSRITPTDAVGHRSIAPGFKSDMGSIPIPLNSIWSIPIPIAPQNLSIQFQFQNFQFQFRFFPTLFLPDIFTMSRYSVN